MANVTGYFRGNSYVSQQISLDIPGQTTSVSVADTWSFSFGTTGTGADQNTLYAATTLHFANSPQTINLQTLTDPYGTVCGFTNIHLMAVKHMGTQDLSPLSIYWSSPPDATLTGFVSDGGKLKVYPSTPGNSGFTVFSAPNQTGVIVGGNYGTSLVFDPNGQTFDVDLQIVGYYMPDFTGFAKAYEVFNRTLGVMVPISSVPPARVIMTRAGSTVFIK